MININKCPECNQDSLAIKQDAILTLGHDKDGLTGTTDDTAGLDNIWLECENCHASTEDGRFSQKIKDIYDFIFSEKLELSNEVVTQATHALVDSAMDDIPLKRVYALARETIACEIQDLSHAEIKERYEEEFNQDIGELE